LRLERDEIETLKEILEYIESTRYLKDKEKALLERLDSNIKTLDRTKPKKAKLPRNYFR
jgi:hypothetical protein